MKLLAFYAGMTGAIVVHFVGSLAPIAACRLAVDENKVTRLPGSPAVISAAKSDKAQSGLGEGDPKKPAVRRFVFHYAFQVRGDAIAKEQGTHVVRVWLPVPSNSEAQTIKFLPASVPAALVDKVETEFGNRYSYFQTTLSRGARLAVDIPYDVTRREVLRSATMMGNVMTAGLDDADRQRFLRADAMVPISGKPLKLLESVALAPDQVRMARQLYDIVDGHLIYKKAGTGWGRGDSNWVCTSGYGNCSDFHSLFMSLARSQGLPVRFEIGFSIPTDKTAGPVVGYHCWAWFFADHHGWIPVDISEANKNPKLKDYYFGNLTADRVTFSTGRDLKLLPQPHSGPLNFFIYPHIEIDGRTLPNEKIDLKFLFRDQTGK
jgi:transglutaminase-like putative cysteine protease